MAQVRTSLCVWRREHGHIGRSGRQITVSQITSEQFLGPWKLFQRARICGKPCHLIMFDELFAIRGENEGNIVEMTHTVSFPLLEAMFGWQTLAFGFEDRQRCWLRPLRQRTAKQIMCAPATRSTPPLAVHDVDWLFGGDFQP